MLLVKRQNNNALSGSVLREKLISSSHKRSMRIWTHPVLSFLLVLIFDYPFFFLHTRNQELKHIC